MRIKIKLKAQLTNESDLGKMGEGQMTYFLSPSLDAFHHNLVLPISPDLESGEDRRWQNVLKPGVANSNTYRARHIHLKECGSVLTDLSFSEPQKFRLLFKF